MYDHCMAGFVTLYHRRCNDIKQFWIRVEISLFMCFFMIIPTFFYDFINIHEYANCTNQIIYIHDNGIKSMCLSFNLMPSFAVYDTQQLRCD